MTNNLGFTGTILLATVVIAAGLTASSARADVSWVIQPASSPVTFRRRDRQCRLQLQQPKCDHPERLDAVERAVHRRAANRPGHILNNGFSNSTVTTASGLLTTVGNTFLSSLNFGSTPPSPASYSQFTPATTFGINGNWLPNGTSASGGSGSATMVRPRPPRPVSPLSAPTEHNQNGQPLSPTPGGGPLDPGGGPNGLGTAGRFQFAGTAGIVQFRGRGNARHHGVFDGSILHFTGVSDSPSTMKGTWTSSPAKTTSCCPYRRKRSLTSLG